MSHAQKLFWVEPIIKLHYLLTMSYLHFHYKAATKMSDVRETIAFAGEDLKAALTIPKHHCIYYSNLKSHALRDCDQRKTFYSIIPWVLLHPISAANIPVESYSRNERLVCSTTQALSLPAPPRPSSASLFREV
jgi:hypothetical protein